jgi:hypothetical protein
MSYEVKYIGMDVHKEAIVIAVLNEGGNLGSWSLGPGQLLLQPWLSTDCFSPSRLIGPFRATNLIWEIMGSIVGRFLEARRPFPTSPVPSGIIHMVLILM